MKQICYQNWPHTIEASDGIASGGGYRSRSSVLYKSQYTVYSPVEPARHFVGTVSKEQ